MFDESFVFLFQFLKRFKPHLLVPATYSYGDRVFGQTQDHEMAFTIPAGEEEAVLEGLEGTHAGGIRYPIPSYLNYTPTFPKHYYEIDKEWDSTSKGK